MISVTGRIRNSSYDAQDGSKRYTTDVIVENFEFLGGGNTPNDGGNFEPRNNNNDNMSNIETTDVSEDPYKDFGEEINISSDDLPF